MLRKCLARVRGGQIDIGDDRVWHAQTIVKSLQPRRLGDRVGDPQRSLHVDDALDIVKSRLGDEVIGPVALGAHRGVVANERGPVGVTAGPKEVVRKLRFAHVEEVDVRVGERHAAHVNAPCSMQ